MVPPTRRTALQMLGAVGTAGLAGCPSRSPAASDGQKPPDSLGTAWTAPDDEWRYPRGGLGNTAYSEATLRQRPTEAWQVRAPPTDGFPAGRTHLAAVTGRTVVLGTERTNGLELTAYDATDGTDRWTRRLRDPDSVYPQYGGLVNGTLYLSDFETDVIAVDAADGTVRWRIDLYERVAEAVPERRLVAPNQSRDRFAPVPAATPDCVYVQTGYGVHGLAPGDGRERWRLPLGDELDDDTVLQDPGGLAVTESRVLASYGRPDQLLYGVRRDDDGIIVDRTTVPIRYPNRPLVAGGATTALGSGVLWSTDALGTLAVGAAGTSAVKWEFQGMASTGAAAFSSPASDGTRLFVCEGHETTGEFVVFALRADTGGLEWLYQESVSEHGIELSSDTEFRVATPAVADGTVLAGYGTNADRGGAAGTVVALSTADGTERWRADLPVAPKDIAPTGTGVYVGGRRAGISGLTRSR